MKLFLSILLLAIYIYANDSQETKVFTDADIEAKQLCEEIIRSKDIRKITHTEQADRVNVFTYGALGAVQRLKTKNVYISTENVSSTIVEGCRKTNQKYDKSEYYIVLLHRNILDVVAEDEKK